MTVIQSASIAIRAWQTGDLHWAGIVDSFVGRC
jgi:hypothetical protein